jgi:hypothetical protein
MITKILQRIRCFIYVIGKVFAIMPRSARGSKHPAARGIQRHQLPLKDPVIPSCACAAIKANSGGIKA